MNQENLLDELSKLLEVDKSLLIESFELKKCANWDSLTIVSVIGILDSSFETNIPVQKIEKIETVGELLGLVKITS